MIKTSRIMATCMLVAALLCRSIDGAESVAGDDDSQVLRKTSKAFAAIAKKAIPAVVFIKVEKRFSGFRATPRERQYNDPFDFFGDDFVERFFGGRRYELAPEQFQQVGMGSGFLISKDGYILTNNHVAGDADKIVVRLHDGREFQARRVGTDPKSEVAIVKIEGDNFPFIELGSSAALEIGEWVIAVGSPFGLNETLTVGVVSAKGRGNIGIAEYEDFIQTDAAINPGNSGGPLLNIEGKAVGINAAILSPSGGYIGIGFAVPIDMARGIKDQLIKNGKVVRGFLGVQLNRDELDEDMAKSFGLKKAGGALISDVIGNSPAANAGLKTGDVVLKVNGKDVESNSLFRNMVASLEPGTKVKLQVFRQGNDLAVEAVIGALPENVGEFAGTSDAANKLGISVRELTKGLADRFGYDADEGVIVDAVEPDSEADMKGLQPGQLVVSVNLKKVGSVAEFNESLSESAKSGVALLQIKGRGYSWYVRLKLN